MHGMTLVYFRLFRKNLGKLREFFGQKIARTPKSYNLRPADARIKSGYITIVPKESDSLVKPGRVACSKSLAQPK